MLFDWDGTIFDTASQGLAAFQKAFAELGVEFDRGIYDERYAPNWYQTYAALGLPKEMWDRADDLWLQYYGAETAALVDGASETILGLHVKGYRLGVVSSGSHSWIVREINASGLGSVFQVVICNEHIDIRQYRSAVRFTD